MVWSALWEQCVDESFTPSAHKNIHKARRGLLQSCRTPSKLQSQSTGLVISSVLDARAGTSDQKMADEMEDPGCFL